MLRQLMLVAFDPSRCDASGKLLGLTSRYIYVSLGLFSGADTKSVGVGLFKLADHLGVSRVTLNKSLKELEGLGLIRGPRSSSTKLKVVEVVPPKGMPRGAWDPGQEELIRGLLGAVVSPELSYRRRMVLAFLISRSDWKGVVQGAGKLKLARCLGLAERQFREHLAALYRGGYLISYQGGLAGSGARVPGSILLNPAKLFRHGWWFGTDLVVTCRHKGGYGWRYQHRISPYLEGLLAEGRTYERTDKGRLAMAASPQRGSGRGKFPDMGTEYLFDADTPCPVNMVQQFWSTCRRAEPSPADGDEWPVSWQELAPVSRGILRCIDEAFFRLSCWVVEEFQSALTKEELPRLSVRTVRAINKELMPLLTSKGACEIGWGQRRWLLQQLRLALIRQGLWSWCCICAAYQWDIGLNINKMDLHRVFPGSYGDGKPIPPIMWLVKAPDDSRRYGKIIEVNYYEDFKKLKNSVTF